MSEKILIGSDPEMFFMRDGKFISAVDKCNGTKDKPFEWEKGFKVHNDNVAIEFNTPPAKDLESFITNHHKSLIFCRDLAKRHGCVLKITSDAVFDEEELNTEEARVFGCNPDFDAWDLKMNPAPSAETNLRTAGGHIHIGVKDLSFRDKVQIVRLLDVFLGIPLKLLEPESRRNELYGRPGCMRDKPYGVEYRTLSNYWLRSTSMMMDVYNTVHSIVENRNQLSSVLEAIEVKLSKVENPGKLKSTSTEALNKFSQYYKEGLHRHVF